MKTNLISLLAAAFVAAIILLSFVMSGCWAVAGSTECFFGSPNCNPEVSESDASTDVYSLASDVDAGSETKSEVGSVDSSTDSQTDTSADTGATPDSSVDSADATSMCLAYTPDQLNDWTCDMGAAPYPCDFVPVVYEGVCGFGCPGHSGCPVAPPQKRCPGRNSPATTPPSIRCTARKTPPPPSNLALYGRR